MLGTVLVHSWEVFTTAVVAMIITDDGEVERLSFMFTQQLEALS